MSRFSKTTLLAGSATAALIAGQPLGDAAQAQAPGSVYNWSGFYVGVHGGAAWTDEGGGNVGDCGPFSNFIGAGGAPLADEFSEGGFDCFDGFIDDLDSSNAGSTFPSFELDDNYVAWTDYDRSDAGTRGTFGGHLGYNIQAGRMVYGVEADFSGVFGDGGRERVGFEYFYDASSGPCSVFGCELEEYVGTGDVRRDTDLDWLSTLRARVGATFAADRLLVYATGGLAIAGTSTSISTNFDTTGGEGGCSACTFSGDDDDDDVEFGLALGAGAAVALTPNVSLGLEYLFAHFGGGNDDEVTFAGHDGRAFDVNLEDLGIDDLHLVRARITYRFGGP